jgi:lipopolysaccharide export system permease protein
MLLFSETIVPLANFKMEYIKNVEIKKQKPGNLGVKEIWYRDANSIFHIESVSPDRKSLQGIHIWNLSPKFEIQSRIDSPAATWVGKRWQAASSITHWPGSGSTAAPQAHITGKTFLPIYQAPEDFALVILNPEEMNFIELKKYIGQLGKAGQEIQPLLVDLHAKISVPFLALIITFLGFPLGLRFGRQGGILVGIFASLTAGFAFWIILALGLSLGHAGSLPPVVGAWISHVIFSGGGVLLMKDEYA